MKLHFQPEWEFEPTEIQKMIQEERDILEQLAENKISGMVNDFSKLDAQSPESAFAKLSPVELAEYNTWLASTMI